MHLGSLALLLIAAASVAVIHSILPDHWVPLAVVGRTQGWTMARVGRISALAATGHVVASLLLAGVVALVGLRFQEQIDRQQGHIVGAVLMLSGVGFLAWTLTGHGHRHGHDDEHGTGGHGHPDQLEDPGPQANDDHQHDHPPGPGPGTAGHEHEHAHAEVVHSHPHSHAEYIQQQRDRLLEHAHNHSMAGRLATIAVPFGVAASPDLTILPIALGASSYGVGAVAGVLALFGIVTIGAFVSLTLLATAAGYQMRGEWLERNANRITSGVLILIGAIAYIGF